jgi:hypothetical protein
VNLVAKNLDITPIVLNLFSCPNALLTHVEWQIRDNLIDPTPVTWSRQMLDPVCFKTSIQAKVTNEKFSQLVSVLASWGKLRFETFQLSRNGQVCSRYSATPSLGIYRASINEMGESVITESQIKAATQRAQEENNDVLAEIEFMLGKPWDDELEIFRLNSESRVLRTVFRTGS